MERASHSAMKKRLATLAKPLQERSGRETQELIEWLQSLNVPHHVFQGLSRPALEAMAGALPLGPVVREGQVWAEAGTIIEGMAILLGGGELRMFRPETPSEGENRERDEARSRDLARLGSEA